jgi:hypothetical protein
MLSQQDFDISAIMIYPNPAASVISFDTPAGHSIKMLSVFDQVGKKVLEREYSQTLNVENLSSGLYFVTLTAATGSTTVKFLKQ